MNKLTSTILILFCILATSGFVGSRVENSYLKGSIDARELAWELTQQENDELRETIVRMTETRVMTLVVTSYSPRVQEADSDPFIAASMNPVREGTIAVSRDLFESGWVFGRKVYIEGHGIFIINDLMNERYKRRVDIFQFSTKSAKKFGKRELKVALLG